MLAGLVLEPPQPAGFVSLGQLLCHLGLDPAQPEELLVPQLSCLHRGLLYPQHLGGLFLLTLLLCLLHSSQAGRCGGLGSSKLIISGQVSSPLGPLALALAWLPFPI